MLEGSSRITKRIVMAGTRKEREVPRGPPQGLRGTVMNKRTFAAGAIAVATRGGLWSDGAVAQATRQNGPRAIPVEVVTAIKKVVPVRLEALGSVTPIANVAVKSRVDSEITAVHFRDGALVREGDLLFTLDSRTLEAQVRQVEGLL